MLTYELKKAPGVPLYEALYRYIRDDILSGALRPGEKLPSKRALAAHLEVSKITVEAAYGQLLAEGYLCSREKVGYFVEAVEAAAPVPRLAGHPEQATPAVAVDLTANGTGSFPFSVWSRLQRAVMLDLGQQLLQPVPNRGLWALRSAIAGHLARFRGLQVQPENILVGAGTDFLYNLLIQLLGRDKVYAVEEPGYGKIRRIYAAGGVKCVSATLDRQGVVPGSLGDAQVLHCSPSHHFPTGLITPMSRRAALLEWAAAGEDRYIIEDDYDSEFRFSGHPMPTLASMDAGGRVIYMNTFSKTLAPSIRISYTVLPTALMERFQRELGFYSCTVPSFEQYTLARFLEQGHFDRHISRMRKQCRARRDAVMAALLAGPYAHRLRIQEQDAGLHFLLWVDTHLEGQGLVARAAEKGVRVRTLASYYHGAAPRDAGRCLVVNYSSLTPAQIEALAR